MQLPERQLPQPMATGKSRPAFASVLRSLLLFGFDILSLLASILLGGLTATVTRHFLMNSPVRFSIAELTMPNVVAALFLDLMLIIWLMWNGRYRVGSPLYKLHLMVIKGGAFLLLSVGFLQYALKDDVSRLWLVSTSVWSSLLLIASWHLAYFFGELAGIWYRSVFVIGSENKAAQIQSLLNSQPALGGVMAGRIGKALELKTASRSPKAVARTAQALLSQCQAVMGSQTFDMIIAPENEQLEAALSLARYFESQGIRCSLNLPLLSLPLARLEQIAPFGSDIVLFANRNNSTRLGSRIVKRAIDVVGAAAALLLLSPLFLVLAILIKSDRGPVFYVSDRIGYKTTKFRCFKFRSMVADAEHCLAEVLDSDPVLAEHFRVYLKIQNDPRVTAFGRFLRRYSLDELPQLFNVLRGDMSLVGPRPILPNEIGQYRDMSFYVSVRPGLTGLWQIGGRSDVSFDDRVALDELHVRNWSLANDFVILVKTVAVIVRGKGAY